MSSNPQLKRWPRQRYDAYKRPSSSRARELRSSRPDRTASAFTNDSPPLRLQPGRIDERHHDGPEGRAPPEHRDRRRRDRAAPRSSAAPISTRSCRPPTRASTRASRSTTSRRRARVPVRRSAGEIVEARAGAAFALDALLMSDANGKLITARRPNGHRARAPQAATAADQLVPVRSLQRGILAP
jgi:hypothetical protein